MKSSKEIEALTRSKPYSDIITPWFILYFRTSGAKMGHLLDHFCSVMGRANDCVLDQKGYEVRLRKEE